MTRVSTAIRRYPLVAATVLVWLGAIAVTTAMAAFAGESGTLGPDTPVGWANRFHVLTCIAFFAITANAARTPRK